jgi:hypothetical protein
MQQDEAGKQRTSLQSALEKFINIRADNLEQGEEFIIETGT